MYVAPTLSIMSFLPSLLLQGHKKKKASKVTTSILTSLDDDVLTHILSYLNASDIDNGVSLSCKDLQ